MDSRSKPGHLAQPIYTAKRFSVGSTPWTYNCNISPEWSVYNIGVKVMSRFQICMILKLEHQL